MTGSIRPSPASFVRSRPNSSSVGVSDVGAASCSPGARPDRPAPRAAAYMARRRAHWSQSAVGTPGAVPFETTTPTVAGRSPQDAQMWS
jgi:hypothetical protein